MTLPSGHGSNGHTPFDASKPPHPKETDAPEWHPLKVLIVEDSSIVRERLVGLINGLRLGIRVITAADGDLGLNAFLREHPDIVLLDIALPGMNGFDLLAEMKSLRPFCVVVMITSYNYPEFRDNALRLGADHFLSKIMEFERITEVITSLATASPQPHGS